MSSDTQFVYKVWSKEVGNYVSKIYLVKAPATNFINRLVSQIVRYDRRVPIESDFDRYEIHEFQLVKVPGKVD